MIVTSSAVLLSLLGIAALYAGWRALLSSSRLVVPAGWACLAVSFVLWTKASNVEFGVVYGFLAMALIAWLVVGLNYEVRRRKDKPRPAAQPVEVDSHSVLQNAGLFVVAVPLAGAASVLMSVAVARLLPWAPVNALVLGVLLLPVLWGLASYAACADVKPLRPAAALTLIGTGCAAYLFLGA